MEVMLTKQEILKRFCDECHKENVNSFINCAECATLKTIESLPNILYNDFAKDYFGQNS